MRTVLLKIKYLHPEQRVALDRSLLKEYYGLSVRAQNVGRDFTNTETIIAHTYPEVHFDGLHLPNCGDKTQNEIRMCLGRMRMIIDNFISGIDISNPMPLFSHKEELRTELRYKYPFLKEPQLEQIVTFEDRQGHLPMLYIIEQYMLSTNQSAQVVIKDYFGINAEHKCYSTAEIASRVELTRERCRQLTISAFPLEYADFNDYVNGELQSMLYDVILSDDPILDRLQLENMLHEDKEHTMHLIAALIDTHILTSVADDAPKAIVRISLARSIKLRAAATSLRRVIEKVVHTAEYELDLLPYIESNMLKHSESDVKPLLLLFMQYLQHNYKAKPKSEHIAIMPPNKLDVVDCAANILREKGEPLSIQDLWDEFCKKYPKHHISNMPYFKFLLCQSDVVRPKGKTGMYLLTEWKDHFMGTMSDYIYEIVSNEAAPVSMTYLMEKVTSQFPNANKSSVHNLMYLCKKHKYIFFENDMIGLKDCVYETNELRERKVVQRQSFEKNLSRLETFFKEKGRYPLLIKGYLDEEDAYLFRWMANVRSNNIVINEAQHAAFDQLLARFDTIPGNAYEYKFKQTCCEIERIVRETGALPNYKEYNLLRVWYTIQRRKYTQYTDNRRLYFQELEDTLDTLLHRNTDIKHSLEPDDGKHYHTPSLFDMPDNISGCSI
ncbi:MAG: hypothetical protein NC217_06540 [Muribaculaceae bacterium]|nr:hypothetical protein [Muribaculaceae bacterium]